MDKASYNEIARHFEIARKLPEAQRPPYLDRVLAGNEEARVRVEEMLAIDQYDEGASQSGPPSETDVNPEKIGPYRILGKIGEGGMGIVYLAEQLEPVRRKVALKLIKPGMDSREILRRFESERRALTLMEHPCIARIYDSGSTEDGHPYFVMEHVQGVPLDEHCVRDHLGIRNRLLLFKEICDAVQHAHHKGVMHRDLKPSNILVETREGKANPKIIDFGLARALGSRMSDQTRWTQQGSFVGTPEYMSPEQANPSVDDVDTRSDIYSLGVILYRLVTGFLPFDLGDFRRAAHLGAYDAIRKKICEEDPLKPSTRVGRAPETVPPTEKTESSTREPWRNSSRVISIGSR